MGDDRDDEPRARPRPVASTTGSPPHVPPPSGQFGAMPSNLPSLNVGDTIADRYRIVRRIGAGAMGEVWEAEHLRTHRKVAIKLLSAGRVGAKDHKRFTLESQATASLQHPNIVRVEDWGTTEAGQPYFVMERLRGRTMAEWLVEGNRADAIQVRDFMLQLCNALEFAHQRGIIHRDLKPSNIFVVEREALPPSCKIIDFGVAKLVDDAVGATTFTATGAILGTPAYISPEQCSGKAVDVRSDVYSLGCIAYELTTGMRPFDGTTLAGVVFQHMFEVPTPPRRRAPTREIPADLEAVILRALCKRPDNRFASVEEMRTAFLRVGMGGAPVTVPVEFPDASAVGILRPSGSVDQGTLSDASEDTAPSGTESGMWLLHNAARTPSRGHDGAAGVPTPLSSSSTASMRLSPSSSASASTLGSGRRSGGVMTAALDARRGTKDGSATLLDELPWAPGSSPYRIKGVTYRGLLAWIHRSIGGGIDSLLERIERPDLRVFIGGYFMPSVFYDALPLAAATAVCAKVAGRDYLDFCFERAGRQARFDRGGAYRALMHAAGADDVLTRIPRHLKQYIDFGRPEAARTRGGVEIVVADVPEPLAPFLAATLWGYWHAALTPDDASSPGFRIEASCTDTDGWARDFITCDVRLRFYTG